MRELYEKTEGEKVWFTPGGGRSAAETDYVTGISGTVRK